MSSRSLIFALVALAVSAIPASAQLYNHPESVVYDPTGQRYLVSNFGDGNIVEVDQNGGQSYFDTTLTRVAGLYLSDGILYCASNLEPWVGLLGYDLATAEIDLFVPIPESNLLNDLAQDDTGHIFITDYWTTGLYRVDLASETHELFAEEGLHEPNGIIYDATNNRLLVTSTLPGYPLHAIDVTDGSVSVACYTQIPSQDGLAWDYQGQLLISSWYSNAIHRLGPDLGLPAEIVSTGHAGPADISYDAVNGVICVPNYLDHSVDFVPLPPVTAVSDSPPAPIVFHGNYPDPFNAATTIAYTLAESMTVQLEVFDSRGRLVATLATGLQEAGRHELHWSPRDVASGVYICRLLAGPHVVSEEMVMVK